MFLVYKVSSKVTTMIDSSFWHFGTAPWFFRKIAEAFRMQIFQARSFSKLSLSFHVSITSLAPHERSLFVTKCTTVCIYTIPSEFRDFLSVQTYGTYIGLKMQHSSLLWDLYGSVVFHSFEYIHMGMKSGFFVWVHKRIWTPYLLEKLRVFGRGRFIQKLKLKYVSMLIWVTVSPKFYGTTWIERRNFDEHSLN